MKRVLIIFCLILILGILSACGSSIAPDSVVKVRPLTVQVLDALTKEPVSGAVVYYKLIAVRDVGFLRYEFREVMVDRLYTNELGILHMTDRNVLLKPYEVLFQEYVYINLDIVPSPTPNNISDFFDSDVPQKLNPISHLKGVIMINRRSSIGEDYVLPEGARYVLMYNWETFKKDKESVVVELERW